MEPCQNKKLRTKTAFPQPLKLPRPAQAPDSFYNLFLAELGITQDYGIRPAVRSLTDKMGGQPVDLHSPFPGPAYEPVLLPALSAGQENVESRVLPLNLKILFQSFQLIQKDVMFALIDGPHPVQMPLIMPLLHEELKDSLINTGNRAGKAAPDRLPAGTEGGPYSLPG